MAFQKRILQQFDRFGRERSGQVTLLFGLMFIPLVCSVGAGIDYARRRNSQIRLDAALDAAVLSVASRKSNVFNASEVQQTLDAQFRGQAASVPQTTILDGDAGFKVWVTPSLNDVTVKAQYSGTVSTTLTRLMKFTGMNVQGTASATRNFAKYMDFYLLLDNSPSMGLAATQADIDKMAAATGGCAFACHTYKNNVGITTENLNDNFYIAKKNNVKLRIDNLRESTQSLVDSAKASMTLSNQYRMAIYSFSDIQTKLSALTTNLDQSKIEAGKIQLEYSWSDERDSQTSYESAFPYISKEMPNSGDGLSASSPIRFLFFVTDGVQDSQINGKTLNAKYDRQVGANAPYTRYVGAIDPALCTSLKNRGIRIGVIYTKYLPLDSGKFKNDYYIANVKPFETTAPENLRSCATDGLYFPVETGGDINEAMQQLFAAAVSSVRLTN